MSADLNSFSPGGNTSPLRVPTGSRPATTASPRAVVAGALQQFAISVALIPWYVATGVVAAAHWKQMRARPDFPWDSYLAQFTQQPTEG